ncbi:MAG: Xaa-Pro peptidase family protein [Candidatus Levybacteria bacterium]|nr:Xaa-Pro peptidase family protein [Candidatus Levybacteria bacterium]
MFEKRIKNLQGFLSEHEIDALLITSAYNIAYLTGVHAFSIEEREARILVTKQNCYLFTDARYLEMIKEKASFVTLCEIVNSNPLSKQLKAVIKKENIKELGFEEENITYKEASDLEETLADVEFIPTVEIVENLRTIKDSYEIENIRKACALTDRGFDYVLTILKPGVTELEIKAKLENFIRLEGGDVAFQSIVAFGKNSAIPHHLSTNYKLQTTDLILLDFGAKVNGYCSDMTRTVFLGKPNEKFQNMYNATKEAQEVTIDYIKTHMNDKFELKNAHLLANNHLHTLGFSDVPHSLGHGVGLQVHEMPMVSPFSDEKLSPGMIITVEPGVYINSTGGVRIEDTALVTPNGLELLTKSPKGLTVI